MKTCVFCKGDLEPYSSPITKEPYKVTYACPCCRTKQDHSKYGETYEGNLLVSDSIRVDKFWMYRNYLDNATYLFSYIDGIRVKLIKRWNFIMNIPLHNLEQTKRKLSIYTIFS
jgi:hypothetical protein